MATTTIRISRETNKALQSRKLHRSETYEEVLERLLEDVHELNAQTKQEIVRAIREICGGKSTSHA